MITRVVRALMLAIISLSLVTPAVAQTDVVARGLAVQAASRARFVALYARFRAGVERAAATSPHSAMASPPTITLSTTNLGLAATPTTATSAADYAPYVRTMGGWTAYASSAIAGLNVTKTPGAATGGSLADAYGNAVRHAFMTDDPRPSWGMVISRSVGFRVLVDGQYVSLTPTFPPVVNSIFYVTLDFGSSKPRRIEIEMSGGSDGAGFTGSISGTTLTVESLAIGQLAIGQAIWSGSAAPLGTITGGSGTSWTLSASTSLPSGSAITSNGSVGSMQLRFLYASAPAYSFWAPPAGLRMIVAGDSYTVGPLASQTGSSIEGDGFARVMGDLLGIGDTWASGLGGTGYLWRSSGGTFPALPERLGDITAWAPDVVVIPMGINDASSDGQTVGGVVVSAATTGAKAAAMVAQVRAALPGVPIVVIGPWRFPGTVTATVTAYEAAIQSAITGLGDPYTVFVPTISAGWQTGIGNAGVPYTGTLTFTGALAAATSATLASAFSGPTSSGYTVTFSDGSTRSATLTNGSTTLSWTGAVTATASARYRNANSGNADFYISGYDKTHPTYAGHAYLARRTAQAVMVAMDGIYATVRR